MVHRKPCHIDIFKICDILRFVSNSNPEEIAKALARLAADHQFLSLCDSEHLFTSLTHTGENGTKLHARLSHFYQSFSLSLLFKDVSNQLHFLYLNILYTKHSSELFHTKLFGNDSKEFRQIISDMFNHKAYPDFCVEGRCLNIFEEIRLWWKREGLPDTSSVFGNEEDLYRLTQRNRKDIPYIKARGYRIHACTHIGGQSSHYLDSPENMQRDLVQIVNKMAEVSFNPA